MKIFYSWQSDLPNSTNKTFIELSLGLAATSLGQDADGAPTTIDQDTSGVPGAPHIAQTIFEKILQADAFVGDLTIVGKLVSADNSELRASPNPNVLAELGYAVGVLGWGRVLIVFNEAFGDIADLPFDLARTRVLRYKSHIDEQARGEARREFAKRLAGGLRRIRDADRAGHMEPPLKFLRASRITDLTAERSAVLPSNLRRMNMVLNWGLTDQQLAETLTDVVKALGRLLKVPRRAAELLCVLMRRSEAVRFGLAPVHRADVLLATEMNEDDFDSLLNVLEHHQVIYVEPRDDTGEVMINWRDGGIGNLPIMADLRTFSDRTGVTLEQMVVQLRFDSLDD